MTTPGVAVGGDAVGEARAVRWERLFAPRLGLVLVLVVFAAWQLAHLGGFQWSLDEGLNLMRAWLLTQGFTLGWESAHLTSYTGGTTVDMGTLDLANAPLLFPPPAASLELPITFRWQRRGVPGDSYRVVMYGTGADRLSYSPYLGDVGEYTITKLPAGWEFGDHYFWWVQVYNGNNGFGYSYDLIPLDVRAPDYAQAAVAPARPEEETRSVTGYITDMKRIPAPASTGPDAEPRWEQWTVKGTTIIVKPSSRFAGTLECVPGSPAYVRGFPTYNPDGSIAYIAALRIRCLGGPGPAQ